jgi:hypothetical protein
VVTKALQVIIGGDDIVVVPKVTATPTGKIYHVTGNARNLKEAIKALDCPVYGGLGMPEIISIVFQPVDVMVRLVPINRVMTTEEICNFPKAVSPAQFFAFGAKFPKEQYAAPIVIAWLDQVGCLTHTSLSRDFDNQRLVNIDQDDGMGRQWGLGYRVLCYE